MQTKKIDRTIDRSTDI